jgi:hypothetical protein
VSVSEQAPSRTFDFADRLRRFVEADDRAVLWSASLSAGIVIVAGAFLAAALNIWIDEAFTMRTTEAGPLEAWARTISFEAQPPLYFILEALWRLVNEASIAFARLPSVFFAGAAAAAIVAAAHRLAPRVPPVVVALLTGLNPVFVWAAAEMRVYALVLFVGAMLTWLFVEAFFVSPGSVRARVWYGVFALTGMYTQYYFGFVLVAHGLALLAVRRSPVRVFVVLMAAVTAGFAPFVRFALMHFASSGAFVTRASFVHAAHEVANSAFAFVLPHDVNWYGTLKIGGFALAAALLAVLSAAGRPVVRDAAARVVVVQWFISLVIFSLLFGASGVPLDPWRHLIVVAPASILVSCIFLSSLTRHRALGTAVGLAAFVVFAASTLWLTYRPPLAKKGDWQRVAAMLSAGDRSTPIAVFPAESALPLSAYLHEPIVAVPRPMPFTVDYVRATTLNAEADVARVLDPVRAKSDRLWLVTQDACDRPGFKAYDYHCSFLEAYLLPRYQMVRSVAFAGSLARLYVRVPEEPTVPARHDGK